MQTFALIFEFKSGEISIFTVLLECQKEVVYIFHKHYL